MRPFRPRGWLLLGFGALALLLAWVLGRRDLLALAVFCCALPGAACAGLYWFKHGFSVKRSLSPALARVGRPVSVTLDVRGHAMGADRMRLREELPVSFHDLPRFNHPNPVVPRSLLSRYQYRMHPSRRGVFTIGPLTAEFSDPFDVAFVQRNLDAGDSLAVAPAAVELPAISLTDGRGQDGSRSTRELAHASDDDAMTREYHYGDPLRRVHWPGTARQGKLMVRAEESVTAPEASLIVDRRSLAFGEPSAAAGLPKLRTTAAFESAVVAAVSIATHLLERGYQVRILDHAGQPAFASSVSAVEAQMEDFSGEQGVFEVAAALAALELAPSMPDAGRPAPAPRTAGPASAAAPRPTAGTSPGPSPGQGGAGPAVGPASGDALGAAFGDALAHKLHQGRRRGPIVAVTGMLSRDEAQLLASTAKASQSACALVLCREPSQARDALDILHRAGWQAAALTPGTPLVEAWLRFDWHASTKGPPAAGRLS
ncbi:DUF58 domain-containing protein [Arthrobacter sp. H35-D1]|uniref:DUF58 domain-containing protein n=1 Tax=Arthrobacter sp. H35-D1 TaxID=3046202 RepID=UPI0024B9A01A|nr:DUF58 domain-containing protein [Arthrobacter sp. H35-D1]MDJ0312360.1 DUF58 domain-containing protein [Arthrobacter sp. H35-D1]